MSVIVNPILGGELPKDTYQRLNDNDQALADGVNSNEQKINEIETGDSNALIGVYKALDAVNTDNYVATYLGLTLFDGLRLNLEVYNQNTGAVTVNLNALGAKDVVNVIDNVENALVAGDFVGIAELQYDLSRDKFQIIGVKSAGAITAAEVSVDTTGYTAISGANQQLLDDSIDTAIQSNIDDISTNADNITINKNQLDILRTGPTVGGTANAITLASATAATFDFTKDLNPTTFEASAANTGAVTVNYDSHGAVAIQKPDGAGGYTALEAGDIPIGPVTIYRKVSGDFFLLAPKKAGAGGLAFAGVSNAYSPQSYTPGSALKSVSGKGWLLCLSSPSGNQCVVRVDGTDYDFFLNDTVYPLILRYESNFTLFLSSSTWLCSWIEDSGDGKIENGTLKFDAGNTGNANNLRVSVTGAGTLNGVFDCGGDTEVKATIDGINTIANGVFMENGLLCMKKFNTSMQVYSNSNVVGASYLEE